MVICVRESKSMYVGLCRLVGISAVRNCDKFTGLPEPLDSILLAVFTVSPNRQYLGMDKPTTPFSVRKNYCGITYCTKGEWFTIKNKCNFICENVRIVHLLLQNLYQTIIYAVGKFNDTCISRNNFNYL